MLTISKYQFYIPKVWDKQKIREKQDVWKNIQIAKEIKQFVNTRDDKEINSFEHSNAMRYRKKKIKCKVIYMFSLNLSYNFHF